MKRIILKNFFKKPYLKEFTRLYSDFHEAVKSIKNCKSYLEIEIFNENLLKKFNLNSYWLRFNCHSEKSRQLDTGQRILNINKIPQCLTIKSFNFDKKYLYIDWNEDELQSVVPIEFIIEQHIASIKDKHIYNDQELQKFDYDTFYDENSKPNKNQVLRWMKCILIDGICLLKNVPIKERMVVKVAELIAPVQNTIYGDAFDVISTPNPINIAYSNAPLEYHMDLMYYESPPGLQFLHCIKNDNVVKGGESIFLDSFLVVHKFREEYPEHFDVLTKIPATFQKIHFNRSRPVFMTFKRPHIVLNHRGQVMAVNWAPPFEGPLSLDLSQKEINDYFKSYINFSRFMNNFTKKIEFKLGPGEIVCFNNRRFLHARNGFDLNGGIRHLQVLYTIDTYTKSILIKKRKIFVIKGCYVNIDEFKSEVLVQESLLNQTENKLKTTTNALRKIPIGNQDYN